MNNNNISFLIVGLGSIGKRHLNNLFSLGIRNLSAVSQSRNILLDDAVSLPSYNKEKNLAQALRKKPTAVVIATPTSYHVEEAIEAVKAGCHVFIEKPISHTMKGVLDLYRFAEEKSLKVQVGFQFRFHPGLIQIKKWLENDEIGKIISVHAHWGEYLPSWHPWEDYRNGYSARKDLGGGVVLTLCHPFDYLRWLFGDIQDVYAITDHISDLNIDTEDVAAITIRFNSGVIGSVYLDYIEQPASHHLVIIGQKGKITWSNDDGAACLFTEGNGAIKKKPPQRFERNTMFLNELSHFIGCIKNGRNPACGLEDGIRALQVALAVKKSSEEKRQIVVPHLI